MPLRFMRLPHRITAGPIVLECRGHPCGTVHAPALCGGGRSCTTRLRKRWLHIIDREFPPFAPCSRAQVVITVRFRCQCVSKTPVAQLRCHD
jgi:hypothetical protein